MGDLTHDQEVAKDAIVKWYGSMAETGKKVFVLSGYAGTGKTYLINRIVDEYLKLPKERVAYATYTGKASSVIIEKSNGANQSMTIHRLIYNAVMEESESEIDGKKIVSKKMVYMRKKKLDADYALIIIDEISMVDKEILEDLLSFGIPLLCCGDGMQLPPIHNDNHLLDAPDATLSEIVRQAADSPIIQVATRIRMGEYVPYGSYGKDVIVIPRSHISEGSMRQILTEADQTICGTNETRNSLNQRIRGYLGFSGSLPNVGEKVICTVNNWAEYLDRNQRFNLVNGTIGKVSSIRQDASPDAKGIGILSFEPDFLPGEISSDLIFDKGIFEKGEFQFDMHQKVILKDDGEYAIKPMISGKGSKESYSDYRKRLRKYIMDSNSAVNEEQINRFEFAYAVTAHKCQGSEFDKVVVFDESGVFREPVRWLYTAVTRAKKKIVLIR